MSRTGRTEGLLHVVSAFALLAAVGGCSPDLPPEQPTYEADIKPIVLSRCVRCHGGGGRLNADPEETLGIAAPFDGYFDHYEDQGDCVGDGGVPGPDCKHGLLFYATDGPKKTLLVGYIDSTGKNRMPPEPSPTLTHRQLEVFHNWLAEMPTPLP